LGGWNVILTAEICTDGIDNDNDGLIDQADPDCNERNCYDGLDNNGNGLTDCDDPACQDSWPLCYRELELAGVVPQRNCQGSLHVVNDTVKCLQIGKFQTIFDFFVYPTDNITTTTIPTTSPTHSPTLTPSLSINSTHAPTPSPTRSPTLSPTSTPPPPTIHSFVVTGADAVEDTMYNCGFDISVLFDTSYFLYTSNAFNNPTHQIARQISTPSLVAHNTPYYLLQKYKFSSSELLDRTLRGVFLFQKGQFGNGSAHIYPSHTSWSENSTTCQSLQAMSKSIYQTECFEAGPAQITHQYGWSYVNLTSIVTCQLNTFFNTSSGSSGSGPERVVELAYQWVEDSVTLTRQAWYSSESLFSPLLVFFYEPNGTSYP
jgi:hypothetical protein